MAKRIMVGVALAGLFIALLIFGGWFRTVTFSIAAVISVYELGALFKKKGYKPCLWPAYAFAALHYIAIARFGYPLMLCLWLLCLVAVAADRVLSKGRTAADSLMSLACLMYPLGLYAALSLIVSGVVIREGGTVGMLLVFACPLIGDTLALFVGKKYGRRKLCPEISPKKTVAGSLGGFAGGVAGALLSFFLQPIWGCSLSLWPMLLLGLVCGGVGQIGDLFASSFKRWADVKDFGTIFPEHGGVMDRLDSVLMCAPVTLLYLYLAVL